MFNYLAISTLPNISIIKAKLEAQKTVTVIVLEGNLNVMDLSSFSSA